MKAHIGVLDTRRTSGDEPMRLNMKTVELRDQERRVINRSLGCWSESVVLRKE